MMKIYEDILFHKTEVYHFHQVENDSQSSTYTSIDILRYSPSPTAAGTVAAWKRRSFLQINCVLLKMLKIKTQQ